MKVLLAALLLGGLLAGCVGTEAPSTQTAPPAPDLGPCLPPALAIPFNRTHDHRDPAQHHHACNSSLLASDDLRSYGLDNRTPAGAHAAAIHGDLLAIAVNGGGMPTGQQGVHFFDIKDPAHLEHLSFYSETAGPVGGNRSIAFSEDGKILFLGRDGGSGPNAVNGVDAIGISDPRSPARLATWNSGQGEPILTVSAGVVVTSVSGNQQRIQYVFAVGTGVNILRYDPNPPAQGQNPFTLVSKYVANDQLTALDALRPQAINRTLPFGQTSLRGRDTAFYRDPVEDAKSFLFVAYSYDGLKVLDISQPAAPVLVGRWLPPADTNVRHDVASVAVEKSLEGRVLVALGAATSEPENRGIASPLWVLDATDTMAGQALGKAGLDPRLLGTWRNPSHAPAGDLGLSIRSFRIEHGLLYIAHGHGGVWAVDLRNETARRSPTAYAYAMPVPPGAERPGDGCCRGHDLTGAPMVLDVAVRDGVVYAADETQGVVAVRMGPPPGPV